MSDWKPYSEMPPMDTPLEVSTGYGVVHAIQTGPMADLINTETRQKVQGSIFCWRVYGSVI